MQETPAHGKAGAPGSLRSLAGVLRIREFLLIWLAQGLSQVAYNAVNFALVVFVESTTHSSTAVGFIIMAFSLPAVLFSGLAGVLVDRASKQRVMVITTGLRTLALAALILVDPGWPLAATLGVLYLVTFVFSTLSQVFGPAEGALIPRLVGRSHLIAANTMFNVTFFASQFLGFAIVGPVLAKVAGVHALFQIATVLYAVCTLLVWRLPHDPAPAGDETPGHAAARVWSELLEGLRAVWRDTLLVKSIGYLSLVSGGFLMLGTVGPAFVTRVLGIAAEDVALIVAPAGVGMLLGLVVVNRLSAPSNRESMIDTAMLVSGLAMLLFALAKPLLDLAYGSTPDGPPLVITMPIVMLLTGIVGASGAFILVPAQTVLQERSPEDMRARVYAAFYTVSGAGALVPVLFAGAISDLVGVLQVICIVAVVFLGVAALNIVRARRVRAAA